MIIYSRSVAFEVKRVLGRMEATPFYTNSVLLEQRLSRLWQVCLEDSSVSASLKPSLLRARLSEAPSLGRRDRWRQAVLFSEEGEGARSLRVGVLSLSMAPQANESEVAAGVDLPGALEHSRGTASQVKWCSSLLEGRRSVAAEKHASDRIAPHPRVCEAQRVSRFQAMVDPKGSTTCLSQAFRYGQLALKEAPGDAQLLAR